MNKKTIVKWVAGAVVLYLAYEFFFCGSKCDAAEVAKTWQFDVEVGQYEKRIDTGLYTGDDANYIKASSELGIIGNLAFTGALEYVDTDDSQMYSSVGTQLETGLGTFDVYGKLSSIENTDNVFELGTSYGVNVFGQEIVLSGSVNDDSEYSAEVSSEYRLYGNDHFDIDVGGALGQTFETADDYTYRLAYARVATTGDWQLFAQLNYLNSDTLAGTDGEWEVTTDFGLVFSF